MDQRLNAPVLDQILVAAALLVGFAGLAGTRTASADESTQSSESQTHNQRQAPSLDGLQENQVCPTGV